ncbi:hypothetical protein BS47DRAFT_1312139 [Hydnum rufescens UP504]|uniref:SH3 domain-containing protein n=1 Tax=Hydnum rufescens UP504 TaxID=1448309 RepID=A0A9P6B998_9AGAM|nr:hypothetical protein BS47DRAFT_1312139 [Hydnum rufescens UP504]
MISPLPQSLPKECRKAEKIFKSFMQPNRNGLDGVIPRHVLANARGFVIFTVVKAGFLLSARGGSGIVIARLGNGQWSAPSAIGTAGMGFGGQAGAELTEFLIVLNSQAALKSFMAAGKITVGGNLSVALGPLGRNGELSGSVNTRGKVAAMYSYSKTRGLFGGLSIEGSVIMERQDANASAYHTPGVTVKSLLSGQIPPPPWASGLYEALSKVIISYAGWIDDAPPQDHMTTGSEYAFGRTSSNPSVGQSSTGPFGSGESARRSTVSAAAIRPAITGRAWSDIDDEEEEERKSQFRSPTSFTPSEADRIRGEDPFEASQTRGQGPQTHGFTTHFDSDYDPVHDGSHSRNTSSLIHSPESSPQSYGGALRARPPEKQDDPFNHSAYSNSATAFTGGRSSYSISPTRTGGGLSRVSPPISASTTPFSSSAHSTRALSPEITESIANGFDHAIALYDYAAQEVGDLSFKKGDIIIILQKSESTDDWWTGRIQSRQGLFPANFVQVV